MKPTFQKATKKSAKLRLGLCGPAGSGKTYSALAIASGLGKRIALIDTEHGSASLYADRFSFDTLNLETFSPDSYVEAIKAAEAEGYEVVIIDSLSHAWMGKDGALEQVDQATKRSGSKNSYFAWRDVTPKHNALVEAIVQCKAHVIATIRSKTEYAVDKDDKGKVSPRKIGTAPIQRDGMEYEFSVWGELDLDHNYIVSKTRCSVLTGKVVHNPGEQLAATLKAWLEAGAVEAPRPTFTASPSQVPAPERRPVPTVEAPKALPAAADLTGLREAIAAASDLAALERLVPELSKLPAPEREAVRPDYTKRKTELTAKPAEAQP